MRPGALFAALPGTRTDGLAFAEDALARGAVALLGDSRIRAFAGRAALLVADDPRRAFARLCARFFAPAPGRVVAVTGTNGKTSTACFVRDLWQALGRPAGYVGTLGVEPDPGVALSSLTTPDPAALHRALSALAGAGVDRLALEASSHGLDQRRLDGLRIAAAAFTQLGRDHLDYHGDMERYFAAKARLFTDLLEDGGGAVLPAGDPWADRLAVLLAGRRVRVLRYGAGDVAIRIHAVEPMADGLAVELELDGTKRRLPLPLFGPFQAANLAAALGLVRAVEPEVPAAELLEAAARVRPVPGRMEPVAETARGVRVVVDYAHTPDALETALRAVRAHVPRGRLAVVFGCGGDRDPGKRPLMGEVAGRLADIVIVTDDNPRSEDPAAIRRAVLVGAGPRAVEIGDRREAIAFALHRAGLGPGDVVLVAGKGHERGQIVKDRVLPFDDREVARGLALGAEAAP
ncbi:UDP-N-acetylmuramoyl-L-alanyl-D-glutamate--2, 6-diaminopimelate ligase [bacterium HR39]|nr:UDP-N-acetylmuramoyl-L-alanyl-D-glutamate--2, 6-diaminopimelate ligase [bacterium HR39]